MKTAWKSNAILSGIFMAALSVVTGMLSTAQAVDTDPNLALPASAAASAAMQAAGPITIKTPSAPASAASAPKAATKVVRSAAPTELTDEEFKNYNFAFKNVDGIGVDKTEVPEANGRWRNSIYFSEESLRKFVSKDQNQAVDFFGPFEGNNSDVVTYNKIEGQATLTAFENKKPVAYTVMNKRGEYTATPSFCKLLANQTNSKNFAELSERAVTCKAFYDKTNFDDSAKSAMAWTLQNLRDNHRRNLSILQNSVAKPMVEAAIKKAPGTGLRTWWAEKKGESVNPVANLRPRNVLSATGTPAEADDRAVLFDLAEACGRLWKDSDALPPAANKKGQPSSGGATKR
ncbi:hypothetical protein BH10BDE1_BH10BDE1_21870 [soil metagenome]